ncbi:MAG: hypothetical protein A2V77_09330 [Anaeromyxobacter sp. RBG_16_69_14]|nr:MAG: hypothetical protein A2V77_09330 [Anaeromyxobacter sp. RBG_16_69_14]
MLSDVTPDDASAPSHGTACGCGEPHGEGRTIAREPPRGLSVISTLAPVIACAFCPVCLASYAKLLSLVGVGLALTEAQHTLLLTSALGISIAASAWCARRTERWSPLLGALAGGLLALAGHLYGRAWLEWGGVGVMIASAWRERRLSRPPGTKKSLRRPVRSCRE